MEIQALSRKIFLDCLSFSRLFLRSAISSCRSVSGPAVRQGRGLSRCIKDSLSSSFTEALQSRVSLQRSLHLSLSGLVWLKSGDSVCISARIISHGQDNGRRYTRGYIRKGQKFFGVSAAACITTLYSIASFSGGHFGAATGQSCLTSDGGWSQRRKRGPHYRRRFLERYPRIVMSDTCAVMK